MARSVGSDRFVRVALRGAETAVQRALVATAQRALDRAVTQSRPTEILRFVDRVKGRPLADVRPFGVVHWRFGYLSRIVSRGLAILRETSPVDSGEYQEEHIAFVDGELVTDLSDLGDARRVVLTNAVPYARVVERGIRGRVPWSTQPQVPREGVYRAGAAKLLRQYRHVADIRFTWVGLDDGAMLGGRAGNTSATRYPAIVIEAR